MVISTGARGEAIGRPEEQAGYKQSLDSLELEAIGGQRRSGLVKQVGQRCRPSEKGWVGEVGISKTWAVREASGWRRSRFVKQAARRHRPLEKLAVGEASGRRRPLEKQAVREGGETRKLSKKMIVGRNAGS